MVATTDVVTTTAANVKLLTESACSRARKAKKRKKKTNQQFLAHSLLPQRTPFLHFLTRKRRFYLEHYTQFGNLGFHKV